MTTQTAHSHGPFSFEDLEGLPDDGYRREIIGGSLIVSPSPVYRHQRIGMNLTVALRAAETAETATVPGPFDWKQPDGGVVVPDMVVIRRSDVDPDGPLAASAVPLLVVEILSPSNASYDRMLKRDLYERRGVPAYWIVDPEAVSLLALRLVSGSFEVEYEGSGTFRTDWPFPIEVMLSELVR